MEKYLCFLFLLLSVRVQAQYQTLYGRVVDTETGEPLPYATVFTIGGRGTLTNAEGDFRLAVSLEEELTFSFVGFEKVTLKARDVSSLVKLKPFKQMLPEVLIEPVNANHVLRQVIKNLKRDFSEHKKERQAYFLRSLLKNNTDSYLIECFTAWRSSVNLRDEEVFSGVYGINAEGERSDLNLAYTNIDRMAEISPSAFGSSYWSKAIKPLNSFSETKRYYSVAILPLWGSGGKLYSITFQRNGQQTNGEGWRRYITGTAYVDGSTLRLLRFEGEVNNAFQWVDGVRLSTSIRFHLNFDYTKGYAAIGSLAVQGGNDRMMYSLLMFSIQADKIVETSGGYVGGSIIDLLKYAGCNESLWDKYDIVRRTKEEDAIAFTK